MKYHIILISIIILFFPYRSAHASGSNKDLLKEARILWTEAKKAENLDIRKAENLYEKIINDYEKIVDPEDLNWGQSFGDMAKERLSVIRCKQSISRREKYKSFDKFYSAFKESFRLRDQKRLIGLIDCEFRIGRWESDNIFIENPEAFSKVIFNFVSYKKMNEPDVRLYSYNDYTTTLSIERVSDPYTYKHMFFFEKGEFWLLKDYITASGTHLDEILEEIYKKP